jgi:hypothetical protein
MRSFKQNIQGSDPSVNLMYDITSHNNPFSIFSVPGQLSDRSGTGICSQIKQEPLIALANNGTG